MEKAFAAVLLVSANFLDSDFIANEELPFILDAVRKERIDLFWIRLTPCYFQATPLKGLQAAAGMQKPLNQMAEFEWMEALCGVCGLIDEIAKKFETPVINSDLDNRRLTQVQKDLKVLAKPAYRETEILIYSGDAWHTQSRVAKGSMTANCWIGDKIHAKPGNKFKIVAITREEVTSGWGADIQAFRTSARDRQKLRSSGHSALNSQSNKTVNVRRDALRDIYLTFSCDGVQEPEQAPKFTNVKTVIWFGNLRHDDQRRCCNIWRKAAKSSFTMSSNPCGTRTSLT